MNPGWRIGCEWDPIRGATATNRDGHYLTTPATVILGYKGKWRLCAECAALPRFRGLHVRRPIVPRTPGDA